MQKHKHRFKHPDGTVHGSLQSCVRTNDLELVGDGTHLTCFEMVGNFSFGRSDYELSVELWDSILKDLRIPVSYITVHPSRQDHTSLWTRRGYRVKPEESCLWSDGDVGGHCCEVFVGDLEIGNLVNPLGHSTDVGFGWERLHMVVEGVDRVGRTSLFRQDLDPIVSDHVRTLQVMRENGVTPGSKGRNYICRRLVRRILDRRGRELFGLDDWVESETRLRDQKLRVAKRRWRKFRDRPPEFWWETFGVLPEEIPMLGPD